MRQPLVSIAVPCYNVAPYLRKCLDSIAAQTLTDWECVCVDDGSTDDTGAILDEYAVKDPRFKVIHQKNGSECRARQTALAASHGDWLAAVDPDDWIDADYLKSLSDAAITTSGGGADMVWCDYFVNHSPDGKGERMDQRGPDEVVPFLRGMYTFRYFGSMWNKLFSRAFVERQKVRFPDARISLRCDVCFVSDFLSRMPKIHYVPVCGYHYYMRPGSALSQTLTRDRFLTDAFVQHYLEGLKLPPELKETLEVMRESAMREGVACERITAADLRLALPEVRAYKVSQMPVWHHAFLWLSLHGGRLPVRALLWAIHRLRRSAKRR